MVFLAAKQVQFLKD